MKVNKITFATLLFAAPMSLHAQIVPIDSLSQANWQKDQINASARLADTTRLVRLRSADTVRVAPVKVVTVGDTASYPGIAKHIAEKVVEQTYRSFPQQSGQPTIIINNIVVPDNAGNRASMSRTGNQVTLTDEELRDFEAYRKWAAYRRATPAAEEPYRVPAPMPLAQQSPQASPGADKLTFSQRFGEKKLRRSGLWIIPMVGIHASNFKADFSDDKAEGRSGWNAGLDFRAHQKRFFIQPGVHYFSSSMDVTSKDSLSSAPLLDGPRIHSLKVPLLLGVYLTRERGTFFKLNVKGGVAGNYVLSVDQNDHPRFSTDNIEEFSYGLNAGIGIELGLLTIDLSHEWGTSPLFKSSKDKNNILRATLGIKI